MPLLDDGRAIEVANVVWATGFRPDHSWIHFPVTGPDGWPMQTRGVVTTVPGLLLHRPAVHVRGRFGRSSVASAETPPTSSDRMADQRVAVNAPSIVTA